MAEIERQRTLPPYLLQNYVRTYETNHKEPECRTRLLAKEPHSSWGDTPRPDKQAFGQIEPKNRNVKTL